VDSSCQPAGLGRRAGAEARKWRCRHCPYDEDGTAGAAAQALGQFMDCMHTGAASFSPRVCVHWSPRMTVLVKHGTSAVNQRLWEIRENVLESQNFQRLLARSSARKEGTWVPCLKRTVFLLCPCGLERAPRRLPLSLPSLLLAPTNSLRIRRLCDCFVFPTALVGAATKRRKGPTDPP